MNKYDFDKFIKEQAEKELNIPEALDWEKMNIPLPQKNKKERKLLLWLFLVFIPCLICWLTLPKMHVPVVNTHASEPIKTENNEVHKINENQITIENQENQLDLEEHIDSDAPIFNLTKQSELNGDQRSFSPINKQAKASKTNSTEKWNPTISSSTYITHHHKKANDKIALEKISTTHLNSNSNKSKTAIHSDSLAQFDYNFSKQKTEILTSIIENEIDFQPILKELFLDNSKPNVNKEHNIALYIATESLLSKNLYKNSPLSETLNSAENFGFGYTASVGMRYFLTKNSSIFTGLQYQKFKSVFSFSESLEPVYNFSEEIKTLRTRTVYHNNSTDFIGINLGASTYFPLTKLWGFHLNLSLIPTVQIDSNGKTIDREFSIVTIEDFQNKPQFSLHSKGETGIYFHLNDFKIKSGIAYQNSLWGVDGFQDPTIRINRRAYIFRLGIEKSL